MRANHARPHVLAMAALLSAGCVGLAAPEAPRSWGQAALSSPLPSPSRLVATASADHVCPEAQVFVRRADEESRVGRYEVEVCGTVRRYKRRGSVYYDEQMGGPLAK
ncbi:MAG: hypothetical protein IPG50_07845 [Myxococcales bacterium]|nr:hypothetical protein [Myxococcales bacterium]